VGENRFYFHQKLVFENVSRPEVPPPFNDIQQKYKCEGLVNLKTVVTSVFCSHTPCGFGGAGSSPHHVSFLPEFVSTAAKHWL
jgi:hypothetical protein